MTYVKKAKNAQAPSNNKVWTSKDDKTLIGMAKDGASTAEIAKELGRTKAAIWGRKYGLGVTGRLTSSKGQGIMVPVSISTKVRKNAGKNSKVTTSAKGSVARSTKPEVMVNVETSSVKVSKPSKGTKTETIGLAMIKKFAKANGAKVTITFE
jgi:hypothetical protein